MARSQMSGQSCSAQADRIAVVNQAIGRNRREQIGIAKKEISVPAAFELFGIGFHGHQGRATAFLQLRQPTGVIEMRVRIQQDLHVVQFETQRLDVRFNLRRSLNQAAIQHDVTGGSMNQVRRDVRGADVIHVADNSKGSNRLVPLLQLFFGLRLRDFRSCDRKQETRHHDTNHNSHVFHPSDPLGGFCKTNSGSAPRRISIRGKHKSPAPAYSANRIDDVTVMRIISSGGNDRDQKSKRRLQSFVREGKKSRRPVQDARSSSQASAPGRIFQAQQVSANKFHLGTHVRRAPFSTEPSNIHKKSAQKIFH